MTNRFDTNYAIIDDNGLIFKGCLDTMVYVWNINTLADFALREIYGHIDRNPKWIIKNWNGSLKLLHIIDRMSYSEGKHTTWIGDPSKTLPDPTVSHLEIE